jgi:uncharacterized protein YukE
MAGVTYAINIPQAQQAVVEMTGCFNDILGEIRTLDGEVVKYLEEWEGRDKVEYAETKRIWDGAFDELNLILARGRDTLDGIIGNYVGAEAQNAGMWIP